MSYQINPLDWHGKRFLSYIPDHFTKIETNDVNRSDLMFWLEKNTYGRVGIIKESMSYQPAGFFVTRSLFLGFEERDDATLYVLSYKK